MDFLAVSVKNHAQAPSPNTRADTENALDAETGARRAVKTGRATRESERDALRATSARLEERVAWRKARIADIIERRG